MNSNPIIDIPPRVIRPLYPRGQGGNTAPGRDSFGGGDELRVLARQIVDHDPALALLLARAGERVRKS
ncbi:MAG: hypothetical protein JWL81_3003 [Verrucomicrobiales bacterium]|nr:hypothetical protein [Verrucomicrobiales bacterium]